MSKRQKDKKEEGTEWNTLEGYNPVPHSSEPAVVTMWGGQSSDKQYSSNLATRNLEMLFSDLAFDEASLMGVLVVSRIPRSEIWGRIDVTLVEEILEMAKTQTTCMTDEFAWMLGRSEIMLKEPREVGWGTIENRRVFFVTSDQLRHLSFLWRSHWFKT